MSVRSVGLLTVLAAGALTGVNAAAAPSADTDAVAYVCAEMSFVGPRGMGLYCNAAGGSTLDAGPIAAGFTIEVTNEGPVFSCMDGKVFKVSDENKNFRIDARCSGLTNSASD